MEKKNLVIYIPVIHKGYLDFLEGVKNRVSSTYIISSELQEGLSQFKPDIASISPDTVKDLLEKIGFKNILILGRKNIKKLEGKEVILVNDEISRNFSAKYLKNKNIEWENVFLRWDKEKVLALETLSDIPMSTNSFDLKMMHQAMGESSKSGDWWRQIGAVLVKNKKILLRANNKDLPSDHTPYQVGEARDFFKAGERHDIANTIHAEQDIVARAAGKNISVKGSSLYVMTFPCPVCAKLIARSGIKKVYFAEGGSNFDAKKVLESAGVVITHVPVRHLYKNSVSG